MKLRTLALALALGFGVSAMAEAAPKRVVHRVPKRKSRANNVKKRKFRKPQTHK
jgi:hypothetical protein